MFFGVWVNISPVQLTVRGQSCNLRLSTDCIQRTNKDVLSFPLSRSLSPCLCLSLSVHVCVCAHVCMRHIK